MSPCFHHRYHANPVSNADVHPRPIPCIHVQLVASCPTHCIMSSSLHHILLIASCPTRCIMSYASCPARCIMSYTLHHVLRIMSYSLHHVLHVASCPSYHLLLIASCPMHHVLLVASRPFVSCPSCWTLCTLSSIVTLRAKVCLHVLSWRHHGEKHAHAFTVHSQTLSCTHTYMRTANTLIYTLFGCPS